MLNSGVIFDQHYTDSLLKTYLGSRYPKNTLVLNPARSIPRKAVLVNLLLFGKAYLSKPYWLANTISEDIAPLFQHDLVEWIPENNYADGFSAICNYIEKSSLAHRRYNTRFTYSLDIDGNLDEDSMDSVHDEELKLRLEGNEYAFDARVLSRKILFLQSALEGNLRHLMFKDIDVRFHLDTMLPRTMFPSVDHYGVLHGSYREAYSEWVESEGSFYQGMLATSEERIDYLLHDWESSNIPPEEVQEENHFLEKHFIEQSITFDCALSTLAASGFASMTGLPLQTTANDRTGTIDTSLGYEAYQLIKVQFNSIQYPLIESVDDVLRLREDKRLSAYREVILGYAKELREQLEDRKFNVLSKFEKDLKLATKDFQGLKKYELFDNLCFYISLPLTMICILSGVPLSDILVIPATGLSKIVSNRKKKELDWLMFGSTHF